MPIRPFSFIPQNIREWSTFFQSTRVVPSDDSVTTGQIAGASAAANNRFYVKRNDAMTFDTVLDADIPAAIARSSDVTAEIGLALDAHEAAVDPHPQYQTQTEGDARYPLLSNTLNGSTTYDPPSLADGAGSSATVTVTGAALGDFALASFSLDLQGITVTAYVSAADTVTVRFQNETGGIVDLGSGTLKARVFK